MKTNQLFSWFFNHEGLSSMLVQNFLTQKTKNIIFTLVILLLIASNLATLLSWRVHESMHNMISQTVSFFSTEMAKKVLLSSPSVQLQIRVESHSKIMTQKLQNDLQEMKDKEQKLRKKLATNGSKAKSAVQLIEKRIQKNLARNLVALPSEAVPAISLATSVAVTAMDIYDACETMKDFNKVLVELGQTATTTGVCNLSIPTTDGVKTMLKTNWKSSATTIAQDAAVYNLPTFNVSFPTVSDIKSVTCGVAKVYFLC